MSYAKSYAAQPPAGFVYVMQCEGFYKIGYSASPKHRLTGVQLATPFPVTLVGCVEGTMNDEAAWHRAFLDKRVSGEWFTLTETDIARVLHEDMGIDEIPGDDDIA